MHLALNFERIDPRRGGAETYVADLCRGLVELGHRVDVYANSVAPGALPCEVRMIPVPVRGGTRLGRQRSFARASAAALEQARMDCSVGFIGTYAHDVLIPQGGVQAASLRANAMRRRPGIARAAYLAGKMLNPKYWVQREVERRQYDPARGQRVIAVSRMVARHLELYHRVPPHRVYVVHNAIDHGRIAHPDPAAARRLVRNRLGLAPETLVGLFAGHNFALKGLSELIQALAARRQAHTDPPIHLLVTGGGDPRPYRRLAHALGLDPLVHFEGYQNDVRPWFAAADFFAQPTYYDPCSLVVLEALAWGLPVISTRQNGATELMTDGVHGRIVSAPGALAELVDGLNLAADPARRRAMSAQARELGSRLTFQTHLENLVKVFEEAAAARARRRDRGQPGAATLAPHFLNPGRVAR